MWPFKKKSVPPPMPEQLPPINEDWAVGDQALCIEEFGICGCPVKGEVYIVASVFRGRAECTGRPDWGLSLRSVQNVFGTGGYAASCFRKITPIADEEAADEGFKALIRHVRKAPVPVPAQ